MIDIASEVTTALGPVLAELRELRAELAALRASQSPRLVSPSEAAKLLGISIATCRRRIADQTLPSRHLGRRVLVDLANVRLIGHALQNEGAR